MEDGFLWTLCKEKSINEIIGNRMCLQIKWLIKFIQNI